MNTKNKCAECETWDGTRPDPRTPPLEEGEGVLCSGCFTAACNQEIEALQDRIEELKGLS